MQALLRLGRLPGVARGAKSSIGALALPHPFARRRALVVHATQAPSNPTVTRRPQRPHVRRRTLQWHHATTLLAGPVHDPTLPLSPLLSLPLLVAFLHLQQQLLAWTRWTWVELAIGALVGTAAAATFTAWLAPYITVSVMKHLCPELLAATTKAAVMQFVQANMEQAASAYTVSVYLVSAGLSTLMGLALFCLSGLYNNRRRQRLKRLTIAEWAKAHKDTAITGEVLALLSSSGFARMEHLAATRSERGSAGLISELEGAGLPKLQACMVSREVSVYTSEAWP